MSTHRKVKDLVTHSISDVCKLTTWFIMEQHDITGCAVFHLWFYSFWWHYFASPVSLVLLLWIKMTGCWLSWFYIFDYILFPWWNYCWISGFGFEV